MASIPLLLSFLTAAAAAATTETTTAPGPQAVVARPGRGRRSRRNRKRTRPLSPVPPDADPAVDGGLFSQAGPADPDWYIRPRLSLVHETGPGIGYHEGFTTFEGMIPLFQRPERSIFFADLRGLLSDNSLLGVNAGAATASSTPASTASSASTPTTTTATPA